MHQMLPPAAVIHLLVPRDAVDLVCVLSNSRGRDLYGLQAESSGRAPAPRGRLVSRSLPENAILSVDETMKRCSVVGEGPPTERSASKRCATSTSPRETLRDRGILRGCGKIPGSELT